jgi:hypothetical protein
MDITRKQFIETLAGGGALLLFSSCGGGGYGGGSMQTSSCTPTIAANHNHALTIAVADLDSPTAKTYDIMGSNTTHTHSVTFSTAQLGQLKAGTMVTVTSSPAATDGHTHSVSVSCVIY